MSLFIVILLTAMLTMTLWLFSSVVANCLVYIEMTQRTSTWQKLDWIMFLIALVIGVIMIPYNLEQSIPYNLYCHGTQVLFVMQPIQIVWGLMLLSYTKREIVQHPIRRPVEQQEQHQSSMEHSR